MENKEKYVKTELKILKILNEKVETLGAEYIRFLLVDTITEFKFAYDIWATNKDGQNNSFYQRAKTWEVGGTLEAKITDVKNVYLNSNNEYITLKWPTIRKMKCWYSDPVEKPAESVPVITENVRARTQQNEIPKLLQNRYDELL